MRDSLDMEQELDYDISMGGKNQCNSAHTVSPRMANLLRDDFLPTEFQHHHLLTTAKQPMETAIVASYHNIQRRRSGSSTSLESHSEASSASLDNTESSAENHKDDDRTCKFRESYDGIETLHNFKLRRIGKSTAGVYHAYAIADDADARSSLFNDGRPFILKLFSIKEAEAIQSQFGVNLSEDAINSYFDMQRNGELQEYVDSLADVFEISALPEEVQDHFEGERVTRADIVDTAIDTSLGPEGINLITICQKANLIHQQQHTETYRLAFSVFSVACARHKEFAVHLMFKDLCRNSDVLAPRLLSFLKSEDQTDICGSLTTDAVAMEIFHGVTLLDLPTDPKAMEVFDQMTQSDLSRCLQDVMHLGSCLLPLGLEHADSAPRNIFVHVDQESGYRATSWIDLESIHPIHGNDETASHLEYYVKELLAEHNQSSTTHFQIPFRAMVRRVSSINSDIHSERDLRLDFAEALHTLSNPTGLNQLNTFAMLYDTKMHAMFPQKLCTTLLYWTLMRSACTAFQRNTRLVTPYLQVLRYIMEHNLKVHGASCLCWVRMTVESLAKINEQLHVDMQICWQSVMDDIVWPLLACVNLIQKFKKMYHGHKASKNSKIASNRLDEDCAGDDTQELIERCVACFQVTKDLVYQASSSLRVYEDLRYFISERATHTPGIVGSLLNVEQSSSVIEILTFVTWSIARSTSLFQRLEEPLSSVTLADFTGVVAKTLGENNDACHPMAKLRASICRILNTDIAGIRVVAET